VMEGGDAKASGGVLARLLGWIAFASPVSGPIPMDRGADPELFDLCATLEAGLSANSPVESSAELVARLFGIVQGLCGKEGGRLRLATPFGWRPWPNPWFERGMPYDHLAGKIKSALAQTGLKAYRVDIRRRLAANAGTLALRDLRVLCPGASDPEAPWVQDILSVSSIDNTGVSSADLGSAPAFTYPEWDVHLGDYLQQHVLLRERVAVAGDPGFYVNVLSRRHGLIAETRRAFERMRPEGLTRLRRWPEGDEFDYRQLIERFVDRRTGNMPGERIFIKRIKQQRDVAVLLLVDLSRSTANAAAGSDSTVLAVQKEAIVVLCEALTVLGDAFAVAGFSGSGRLGVEYFRIKGFAEPMSDEVAMRIGAISPQHNTRMGAAIRHAGRELEKAPAKARLLLMLSDGFPNDADYKHEYAVADTRKALLELTARNIRFHVVTVSLPVDPQLDELYGKARHHLITDVRELPARLLRVYGALTRS
jgi:nitric oxide reductase NorD protein